MAAARLAAVVLAALLPPLAAAGEPAPLDRARALIEAGELQAAIDLLQQEIETNPTVFDLRLELARAGAGLARVVGVEDGASAAALAWLDALKWAEEASRLNPIDREGLRLIAEAAEGAGEAGKATEAWLRLVQYAPDDLAVLRRAGFALAIAGRHAEAVEAFRTAEAADGPEPASLLARAEAHDALGQAAEAIESAARLFRMEADRDAPSSSTARRALDLLWSAGRKAGAFDRLEAIYTAWSGRYPTLTAPPYYLGHARIARNRYVPAVEAFRVLTERAPRWAEAWRLLAGALVDARRAGEAADAMEKAIALEPPGSDDAALLDRIARAAADGGDVPAALATLERFPAFADGFPDLRLLHGDLLLRAGRDEEAARLFAALAAVMPGEEAPAARLQKAIARLLAAGGAPSDLAALRTVRPEAAGRAEVLADFEKAQVLVRTSRGADGGVEAGAFRLARRLEHPLMPATLAILLLPEIDSRPLSSLRFDVRGPAGSRLRVGAKDRWDDYDLELAAMNRFLHEQAVTLTGERQTVVLPLAGFAAPGDQGTVVRLAREGLRGVTFELRPRAGSSEDLAPEVVIDDVALVAADGTAQVLADFDVPAEEVIASFEGPAAPLQSVPRIGQTVEDYPADSTTFVNPNLLGSQFDPAMAHSGTGSIRVAGETRNAEDDGRPAALRLDFRPARDFSGAKAIVFFARGEAGGERLVVTLSDRVDEEIGSPTAAAPRTFADGRLVTEAFVLDREWKAFRIPLADYPEVLPGAIRSLRFVIGGALNDKSARVYVDDVGVE